MRLGEPLQARGQRGEALALRADPAQPALLLAQALRAPAHREQIERAVEHHRVVGVDLVEGGQLVDQRRMADAPQLDPHRLVAADDRPAGARELAEVTAVADRDSRSSTSPCQ